ncbi:hypothetical protein TrRE_jg934, partial [Triparma retinervis]
GDKNIALISRRTVNALRTSMSEDDPRWGGWDTCEETFLDNLFEHSSEQNDSKEGNYQTVINNLRSHQTQYGSSYDGGAAGPSQSRYGKEGRGIPRTRTPSGPRKVQHRGSNHRADPHSEKDEQIEYWQVATAMQESTLDDKYIEADIQKDVLTVQDDGTVTMVQVLHAVNADTLEGDLTDYCGKAKWENLPPRVSNEDDIVFFADDIVCTLSLLSDSGCIGSNIVTSSNGAISEKLIEGARLSTADKTQESVKIVSMITLPIKVKGFINGKESDEVVLLLNALVVPGLDKRPNSNEGFISELDLCNNGHRDMRTTVVRSSDGNNSFVFNVQGLEVRIPLDGPGQGDRLKCKVNFLDAHYTADALLDLRKKGIRE